MTSKKFDIVIIGAGPGGYVTAIRAAQLGFNTAIVEKKHLGGICLNWGCIPTKSILRSAEIYQSMLNAADYGLSAETVSFDMKSIIDRSREISNKLNNGVKTLLKKNKVTIIYGFAKLSGVKSINVTADNGTISELSANHIIIATGASPKTIKGLEPDNKLIWTYFEALRPNIMPKSLLIVGAGAIGIEFASMFNTFGSKVTIIEVADEILQNEDEEISKLARKQLEASGIEILTSAKIKSFAKGENNVTGIIEKMNNQQKEITIDRVILAIGVKGNTDNLGLEETRVLINNNQIVTNLFGQTNEPSIFAIGDVAGPPWLAHKAEHEGVVCVGGR